MKQVDFFIAALALLLCFGASCHAEDSQGLANNLDRPLQVASNPFAFPASKTSFDSLSSDDGREPLSGAFPKVTDYFATRMQGDSWQPQQSGEATSNWRELPIALTPPLQLGATQEGSSKGKPSGSFSHVPADNYGLGAFMKDSPTRQQGPAFGPITAEILQRETRVVRPEVPNFCFDVPIFPHEGGADQR